MTQIKLVKLILCELTLLSILKDDQNDLDIVESSYSICLCTSELLSIPNLYAQTVLTLRGYIYITYFEIWALNNKTINKY